MSEILSHLSFTVTLPLRGVPWYVVGLRTSKGRPGDVFSCTVDRHQIIIYFYIRNGTFAIGHHLLRDV